MAHMIGLTPDEKKVILFFLAVNAIGLGVLVYKRTHPASLPGLKPVAAGLPATADSNVTAVPQPPPLDYTRPKKELLTGKININQADESTLQQLPGIGPAMAQRIAVYRRTEGRFRTTRELGNVKGIGPKKLKLLLEHVSVGP
jgi:competence ComEA-like helix-hairpin-helix protein